MRVERWVSGYHAELSNWLEKGQYYLNIQYYNPGGRFPDGMVWEKSFLLESNEPEMLENYFDSLVCGLAGKEELRRDGRLVPQTVIFPDICYRMRM